LKSSWAGGCAPLLCRGRHNSGALPRVHQFFKRLSYFLIASHYEYLIWN